MPRLCTLNIFDVTWSAYFSQVGPTGMTITWRGDSQKGLKKVSNKYVSKWPFITRLKTNWRLKTSHESRFRRERCKSSKLYGKAVEETKGETGPSDWKRRGRQAGSQVKDLAIWPSNCSPEHPPQGSGNVFAWTCLALHAKIYSSVPYQSTKCPSALQRVSAQLSPHTNTKTEVIGGWGLGLETPQTDPKAIPSKEWKSQSRRLCAEIPSL